MNKDGLEIANAINQRFVEDIGFEIDQNGMRQNFVKLNDAGVQYAKIVIHNTRLVMAARMHTDAHQAGTVTPGNPQTSASPYALSNQTNQPRAR
ncbi:hypothetical protein ACFWD7_58040 [Streptomyces mirabilis]|uniref:hypothetical protein n=1 Tax=Streptomyces mirabilis TaxID=68239 RepID=UPI00367743C4